jgi:hypothetical protein
LYSNSHQLHWPHTGIIEKLMNYQENAGIRFRIIAEAAKDARILTD